jgi:two-component system, NarL family, nitrate/nitrite response regulator NarL
MKILPVDDSRKFLSGLKNMLESRGHEVAGVALSAEEALRKTLACTPDLMLMDIQMPGENGIEATRALKQLHPSLKIVMMTVSDSDEHLFDAIVAGAATEIESLTNR